MLRTLFRYKLLRVKMKISFSAMCRTQTLKQLWFNRILTSFNMLKESKQIEIPDKYLNYRQELLVQEILSGKVRSFFAVLIRQQLSQALLSESNDAQGLIKRVYELKIQSLVRQKAGWRKEKKDMLAEIFSKRINKHNKIKQCFDVFQDFKLDDKKMYEFQTAGSLVNYKLKREKLYKFHQKIQMLKQFKFFSGYSQTAYLIITLKEIELMRKIFILDIEQGDEVVIPDSLSQKSLPLSYQFYDPILNIVQQQVCESVRCQIALKNKYVLDRILENVSRNQKFLQFFSSDYLPREERKPCLTHHNCEGRANDINITKSYACMTLQNSKYLIIENDVSKLIE